LNRSHYTPAMNRFPIPSPPALIHSPDFRA
jgi:hypothetical protein